MATKKKVPTSATAPTIVSGFKVADANGKCRGMQYEVGGEYNLPNAPILCDAGLHFCQVANDCFDYYSFDPTNRVFAVEAFGTTISKGDKSATNGLRILRELTWHEVLTIINSGKANTGRANSGDRNSGDRNSGDLNSGDLNSGDLNSGYLNSGNLNSGNLNSGYLNSGNRNSGIFCTETPKKIELFNKPSVWSLHDFLDCEAYSITQRLLLTEWRSWSNMTDHEKEQYPRAETSEGYTKKHDYKAAWSTLWDSLNAHERKAITSLPNFDNIVFYTITGISL